MYGDQKFVSLQEKKPSLKDKIVGAVTGLLATPPPPAIAIGLPQPVCPLQLLQLKFLHLKWLMLLLR